MFNRNQFLKDSLQESAETKLNIEKECAEDIFKAVDLIKEAYLSGKKVLLCGNGGSAADSQHIATELMVRLSHHIERPALPAIALTTDSSNLTAGGNDIGFENIFARNVEGLGNQGDILIAISTSGNSVNVIKAVEKGKEKGLKSIGMLGGNGGKLYSMVDVAIVVPSKNVQRIQEGHITIAHIICEIVENELFG
ncbi:D-sedoheptulose-7-phosphate isomerase [Melioribacter sp. OK-6-Me]|uniref:D-sedoheptulose-7-phosphate isomerase n=1 Tax=unclassified Melioribacter TaxID=2627329 RepID=UPI003ED9E08F